MDTKELLEKTVNDRLGAYSKELIDEKSFKEAMEATDRLIELEKIESAKEEQKKNRRLKWVEVGAVPFAIFGLNYIKESKFIEVLCKFETENTVTSSSFKQIISRLFSKK